MTETARARARERGLFVGAVLATLTLGALLVVKKTNQYTLNPSSRDRSQ